MNTSKVDGVEVAWRPGCPFCIKLRSSLRLRGVITTDVNIWADPAAAQRVRKANGGDETVPTVFIGTQTLINPSARQVIATMKHELPDRADLHQRLGVLGRLTGRY